MLKRIITSILLGSIALSLAGCGAAPAAPADPVSSSDEPVTEAVSASDESAGDTAEEIPEETGDTTLTFIGHASIKLKSKDGRVVFIDPANYSPGAYDDEADFVLVTHAHSDHTPCDKVKMKEDTVQITWKEALIDGVYQSWDFDGIKIEAVAMGGNSNHAIGSGVGYLVTVDGICVYHAGDSSNHEALHYISGYDIDYALYPIDGVYNMDAEEATELANLIGAKHNIPIHISNASPKVDKRDKFNPEGRLIVMEGDTIVLE